MLCEHQVFGNIPSRVFLTEYPDGVLFLRDGSESLMYAYLESRTAYFMPGVIFLALVRDALNLVSSPENLGRQVFLKGDLVESYYGICGLKNIREFEFK